MNEPNLSRPSGRRMLKQEHTKLSSKIFSLKASLHLTNLFDHDSNQTNDDSSISWIFLVDIGNATRFGDW